MSAADPDPDSVRGMVCVCSHPEPIRLGLWNCYECRLCLRLVVDRDVVDELERRRLAHPSAGHLRRVK